MMFVFRTETETDTQVDRHMALMEPLIEMMGVEYYRDVCGDPIARVRVIDDSEIQTPFLLAKSRN